MTDWHRIVAAAVAKFAPVPGAGVAIAVIKDHEPVFVGGFGQRDPGKSPPVDPDTMFGVGSLTKAMTSFVALRLAEDGIVDLDAPVRNYLPDFAVADAAASANMTLTDLLSGQSGIPRHDLIWYAGPFSRQQLYYRARYLDPDAREGAGFRRLFTYSSVMYAIAGLAVEAAARRPWQELVEKMVLAPLAMQASFDIDDLQAAPNHASPCKGSARLPYDDLENIAPAGAINANLRDMVRWVRLLLDGGVAANGCRLIEQQSLARMFTRHIAAPPSGGYGLGWFIDELSGKRLAYHTGDAQGYSAYASLMPDDGIAVVALSNQNIYLNGAISAFPANVAGAIYSALLKDPSVERKVIAGVLSVQERGRPATPAAGTGTAPASAELQGIYSNPGYGDIAIANVLGRLVLGYYQRTFDMVATGPDKYNCLLEAFGNQFHPPVVFDRDSSGQVVGLRMLLDPLAKLAVFQRRM